MKKNLLYLSILLGGTLFAQELQSDNFNGLTLGDIGTDITGATAGQDGWFTFASNGTAPTTATNAGNSNFQVVVDGFEGTNGIQITGSNGDKGSRFMWKSGLPEAWAARVDGNNIIQVEYDFFTGPSTTSTSQFGVRLFGLEGTTTRTLNGFVYSSNTRVLAGVAYLNNAGTFGTFLVNLATGGLVLEENTWYRIGFGYDTETGQPFWNTGTGGTGSIVNTVWAGPFLVDEVDFVVGTPPSSATVPVNTVVKEVVFDNLLVEAVSEEALLNISQISNIADFSIYPNPINNVLNITTSDEILIEQIVIYDLNGRMIKSSSFDNSFNVQVDTSDLASGVYAVEILSNLGKTTKKVVKQ